MDTSVCVPEMQASIQLGALGLSTVGPGWSYQQHCHSGFELLHCMEGDVIEWTHGEPIAFSRGNWLLIGPGVRHSTINETKEPFAFLSVHFDIADAEIRDELKGIHYILLREGGAELDAQLRRLLALIGEADARGEQANANRTDYTGRAYTQRFVRFSAFRKLAYQSLVVSMLAEVLRLSAQPERRAIKGAKTLNPAEIELARTIERMLAESVFAEVAIQDIARELFVSRSHCNAIFKKVYGIPPRQYASLLKADKAKELIRQSGLSVEEIGERLGFSCVSSFSRQFRRWTGLSPLQYRRTPG